MVDVKDNFVRSLRIGGEEFKKFRASILSGKYGADYDHGLH